MNPLRNFEFDPTLPLQTKRGAQQALRSGHNTIDDLIRAGLLEVIYIGRIPKITTDSIMRSRRERHEVVEARNHQQAVGAGVTHGLTYRETRRWARRASGAFMYCGLRYGLSG